MWTVEDYVEIRNTCCYFGKFDTVYYLLFIILLANDTERVYIVVSRRSVGLLVKCCVSNSSHSNLNETCYT